MSDNHSEKNERPLGDDIADMVQNAINSVDYNQLGSMIGSTVDKALAEARTGIKKSHYEVKKNLKAAGIAMGAPVAGQPAAAKPPMRAPVAKTPRGTYSGPVMIMGTVFSLASAAAVAGGALIFGAGMLTQAVAVGLLALGAFLGTRGAGLMKRVSRFKTYKSVLRGRAYCDTAELSDSIGKSKKYVTKDLRKMIDEDMFPEGRLSDDNSVLMLSDEAYEAYEQMQEGARMKEEEARLRAEAEAEQRRKEAENPVYKEVRLVIEEGEDTLAQIQAVNRAISDPAMTAKLTRLETVIRKIFEFIEENPGQIMEMRRFMGYYLPTTLKLVNAYRDLDAQPVQGANIRASKAEIEGTLDTISGAFEKLLDSFYQSTAMDVSTDISVMKNLFAQDGLVDDGLKQEGTKDE